jgi:hypothetical protein
VNITRKEIKQGEKARPTSNFPKPCKCSILMSKEKQSLMPFLKDLNSIERKTFPTFGEIHTTKTISKVLFFDYFYKIE